MDEVYEWSVGRGSGVSVKNEAHAVLGYGMLLLLITNHMCIYRQ
jgi:hypothetical protein